MKNLTGQLESVRTPPVSELPRCLTLDPEPAWNYAYPLAPGPIDSLYVAQHAKH